MGVTPLQGRGRRVTRVPWALSARGDGTHPAPRDGRPRKRPAVGWRRQGEPRKRRTVIFQCPLPSLTPAWDMLPLTCLARVPQEL